MAGALDTELRGEFIDSAVKAVALAEYKLKILCIIDSSSNFLESYYQETNTELTGGTGSSMRGIPRLSPFPYAEVAETKATSVIEKYGAEGLISLEDEMLDNLPMLQRTILRIGRTTAYHIDVAIEAAISSGAGNSSAISAGYEWDSATIANRDPVKNILDAIQTIRADNLDALNGNGYLVVNGTDWTNIISNSKFTNNPSFKTADVVSNGVVGQIAGLKVMVTEVITADTAYVIIANSAMVWKQAKPLTVEQIRNPGISTTIRAYEMGALQIIAPNGICKITNTRA